MNRYRPSIVLLVALVAYLGMAIAGIRYGLPDRDHAMSYNCDEGWLEFISRLRPAEGKLNPAPELGHPTMYLFTYAAALYTSAKVGYLQLNKDKEWYRVHPEQLARFYLVGRYLQVVCGILLLIGIWMVARLVFGESVANIATALLAITPDFIATSHFSQANLPVALFGNAALFCLLLGTWSQRKSAHWLYGAALFTGFAISTKLSGLALIAPLGYYTLRYHRRPMPILLTALAIGFGFFIGSPFSVISPHTFWPALLKHGHNNYDPFPHWINSVMFQFQVPYNHAMGIPLMICCALGIAYALFHRNEVTTIILIWIAAFFWATIRVGVISAPSRILIVIPAWILLFAVSFEQLRQRLKLNMLITASVVGVLICGTALPTLAVVQNRRETPIQKLSSQWLIENVPTDKTIGLLRDDFWYTPDVIRESYNHPERMEHPYAVSVVNYSRQKIDQLKPDYIVTTEIEKLRCSNALNPSECLETVQWLDSNADYEVARVFPRRVHFLNWEWNRPEYRQYPMHHDDDLFTTAVWIYRRKAA